MNTFHPRGTHRARVLLFDRRRGRRTRFRRRCATGRAGCCTARNSAAVRSPRPRTAQPGEPIDAGEFRCVWPERLTLDRRCARRHLLAALAGVRRKLGDAARQRRTLAARRAPQWRAGARWSAVDDAPSLRLEPGSYTISGRFEWSSRPEVAAAAGVDGDRRSHRGRRSAWRSRNGRTAACGSANAAAPSRRPRWKCRSTACVQDEIPAYLLTRIRLNVAGEAREELLGARAARRLHAAVADAAICRRASSATATLRVQLRAGSHEVIARRARHRRRRHARAARRRRERWPREEIWSFAANDALRVAAAGGRRGHRSRAGERAARVASIPGVPHGCGREARRRRTQPRPLERRRQPPDAEPRLVARLRSRRFHGRRQRSAASCAATGASTCWRRSRCRARGRTTISCW